VLFDAFGKSRRRLIATRVATAWRSSIFEHECGLVHTTRDEVTVHRLADEPGKASAKVRRPSPTWRPQRAKGSRVFGVFVDQLKRLPMCRIRNCTEPPTFAVTKRLNSNCAQHLRQESTSVIRESTAAGRDAGAPPRLPSAADCLEPVSLRRGLRCQDGGSNCQHVARDGARQAEAEPDHRRVCFRPTTDGRGRDCGRHVDRDRSSGEPAICPWRATRGHGARRGQRGAKSPSAI